MAVHLTDLPIQYQQQALKKLQAQQTAIAPAALDMPKAKSKRSKYNNKRTPRTLEDGTVITFASKKEAERYDDLLLLQKAGEITDLRLQVDFTLQEAYMDPWGKKVNAIRYKADFTYCKNGKFIVEDVKGMPKRTDVYIMKKKMMKERLGIDIQEV